MPNVIQAWKGRAAQLKRDTYALVLAYRDPRTPWAARLAAACVVAYAFSPLDLIPDFIPVLGALDDLILLPLGVALALRLIPAEVMADSRARAAEQLAAPGRPGSRAAVIAIVAVWLLLIVLAIVLVARAMG